MSPLPPRPFLGVMALRTAMLWLFVRLVTWAGPTMLGSPQEATFVGPAASAPVVFAAVLFVIRVEVWRRSERILLANLGYSFGQLAVFVAAECALIEVAMRLSVG